MSQTSFEATGKADDSVNGYGGSRTAPIIEPEDEEEEVEMFEDNEDDSDIELKPDEEVVEEDIEIGPEQFKRPDDYDLLTFPEQQIYDKNKTNQHSYILYIIFKKNSLEVKEILDKRAKEYEEQYYRLEEQKMEVLEDKDILQELTEDGSEARISIRKKLTSGMRGKDEDDEEGFLNQIAFEKYLLKTDIKEVPIDSLFSKAKQFAPADVTVETRGGNVKRLYEVKTVNYYPKSKNHQEPRFYCPLNKIANLYGYPEGLNINNTNIENQQRIKEIASFKNAPSKLERKLYWTVLNKDEKENIPDLLFPEKIGNKPNKARNRFKDKVSYVDLNDRELKKDVEKYIKDKSYRPDVSKPYIFEMSPVPGNNQMTVRFTHPKKITNTPYKLKKDYTHKKP